MYFWRLSYRPVPGERKSGMPALTDIPAPAMTTMRLHVPDLMYSATPATSKDVSKGCRGSGSGIIGMPSPSSCPPCSRCFSASRWMSPARPPISSSEDDDDDDDAASSSSSSARDAPSPASLTICAINSPAAREYSRTVSRASSLPNLSAASNAFCSTSDARRWLSSPDSPAPANRTAARLSDRRDRRSSRCSGVIGDGMALCRRAERATGTCRRVNRPQTGRTN